jgi:hypothetical protein
MFAPSIERQGARCPRTNAIRPVRANSKMPYSRISSVNPAIWPAMIRIDESTADWAPILHEENGTWLYESRREVLAATVNHVPPTS